MEVNRRTALKTLALNAAKAAPLGVGIAVGHALLRDGGTQSSGSVYPAAQQGAIPVGGTDTDDTVIRPPGAVEEDAFLAGCIRCYRCQDVCEPGAIQFYTESDGKHYHTPYVDPAIRACTLCMKCTQICPTGVLEPMELEDKSKVEMASVELREDLCLSYKAKRIRNEQAMLMEMGREATESEADIERRGPCGECYMFCPLRERAIQLEPGSFLAPLVFTEHCVGCGLCEEICRVMLKGDPAIRVVPTRMKA